VRYVTDDVACRPIVLQTVVPVLDYDTPDALLARIREQAYQSSPSAIALHAAGWLRIATDRLLRLAGGPRWLAHVLACPLH
jgi:phosphoribosylglycinamide formyltransferase 1